MNQAWSDDRTEINQQHTRRTQGFNAALFGKNRTTMETMMKNRVQLMGNLGRDPELKEFEGGKRRLRITVATNETFEYGHGQTKEDTQWHQVVAWGRTAEQAAQVLKKGSRVAIEGRLVHRSYDDKEGQKRYVTEVVMNQFQLMENTNAPASAAVAMM